MDANENTPGADARPRPWGLTKLWPKLHLRGWLGLMALAIICVMATAYLGGGHLFPPEPAYQGKTLSVWLDFMVREMIRRTAQFPAPRGRGPRKLQVVAAMPPASALTALQAMGRAGIPYLAAATRQRDSLLHNGYVRAYPLFAPVFGRVLPPPRPDAVYFRQAAAEGLMSLGDLAKGALPALLAASRDSDSVVRGTAVGLINHLRVRDAEVHAALNRLLVPSLPNAEAVRLVDLFHLDGPLAIQALLSALKDKDRDLRQFALMQLKLMPGAADTATRALLVSLRSTDPAVRTRACEVLGGLNADPNGAVPALVGALRDPDRMVRIAAAEALPLFGRAAQAALPALRELNRQIAADPTEQYTMRQALTRIDPELQQP